MSEKHVTTLLAEHYDAVHLNVLQARLERMRDEEGMARIAYEEASDATSIAERELTHFVEDHPNLRPHQTVEAEIIQRSTES